MNSKITIGIFNDSFYPLIDGVTMVVDNYAKRLTKYANVIVFVPKYNDDYEDDMLPYKVVRCKSIKVPLLDYSLALPKITNNFKRNIKKYNLDIIHIHSPFAVGKYGVNYARKNNIPVIGTMHSQFERDFEKYIPSKRISNKLTKHIVQTFNNCDECWAVNSEVAKIYHEEYGYKKIPKVVNNATDILPVPNINQARKLINKQYKLSNNDKVFLFVGRINLIKNILFITDALKIVKDKRFKFKMLFVGAGHDETLLADYIDENNLKNDIILCGQIIDRELMASLYARADLFLFPSLYDASSLVQIEAASQKLPTLFLEGAVTSATVTPNVNGFTAKNDVFDYANKIIEVMKNKKLYNEVANNAYKDLYKNWDSLVADVYYEYLKLINKNN